MLTQSTQTPGPVRADGADRHAQLQADLRVGDGRVGHEQTQELPTPIAKVGERLVIGTGATGSLPVMDEVKQEAARRRVELVMVPTEEAIRLLAAGPKDTNAILHVTC